MKKLFAVLTGLAATAFMSLSLAGPASAANETAAAGLTMKPQSGKLSKTGRKPVDWRVDVEIKAPYPASPTVLPMKRVETTFPSDMTFNPKPDTPVCPDDQVGPDVNLSFPPDVIIARCPNAVLGNGTAGLYLGQANSANGPNLTDPVLVVFNGGTNNAGNPRLKIYGYSQGTGAGVYMEGALVNGVLDVQIPRLTFDSGTGDFNLNIPGSNAPQENRRGVDPTYVQAKCSTGTWVSDSRFTLGTRDSADNSTSPDSTVDAPTEIQDCVGVNPGGGSKKGKFSRVKVKGPGKVKRGKMSRYKVIVKNVGKKTIKNAKIKVSGKGVGGKKSFGKLKKGQKKTVKIKLKFKKKGKVKTRFKAIGKGTKTRVGVKKVKVK